MSDFTEFSREAFSAGLFKSIIDRYNTVFCNKQASPEEQAWLGRACVEARDFTKARLVLIEAICSSNVLPG